jgi:hypothetical protein
MATGAEPIQLYGLARSLLTDPLFWVVLLLMLVARGGAGAAAFHLHGAGAGAHSVRGGIAHHV